MHAQSLRAGRVATGVSDAAQSRTKRSSAGRLDVALSPKGIHLAPPVPSPRGSTGSSRLQNTSAGATSWRMRLTCLSLISRLIGFTTTPARSAPQKTISASIPLSESTETRSPGFTPSLASRLAKHRVSASNSPKVMRASWSGLSMKLLSGRRRACVSSRVLTSVYALEPEASAMIPVRSDPSIGQELGVVALPFLRFPDLLGRVELGEVDPLDVVAGPLEGVLVDVGSGGIDPRGPGEANVRLRPLAIAGRAALGGLEGLAEAALADGQDVLLGVHARGDRPQDVLDVVDVHVLVDHDAEPRPQRDRQRRGQDVSMEALVARPPLADLEDHAAPVRHAHGNVRVDAEAGHDALGELEEAGLAHEPVQEAHVHAVDDQAAGESAAC